jgi:NADH:ubiquinone oxidoreductase subunit 11 or 4L (chain K)
MIPLNWYLILAAGLFCIGLLGVLTRRNVIGILMGLELMLNAVNINLLSFWRLHAAANLDGAVFSVIVFGVAAAEVAVGLAIVISVYRSRRTVNASDIADLKG